MVRVDNTLMLTATGACQDVAVDIDLSTQTARIVGDIQDLHQLTTVDFGFDTLSVFTVNMWASRTAFNASNLINVSGPPSNPLSRLMLCQVAVVVKQHKDGTLFAFPASEYGVKCSGRAAVSSIAIHKPKAAAGHEDADPFAPSSVPSHTHVSSSEDEDDDDDSVSSLDGFQAVGLSEDDDDSNEDHDEDELDDLSESEEEDVLESDDDNEEEEEDFKLSKKSSTGALFAAVAMKKRKR